jgi:hypothetical protein
MCFLCVYVCVCFSFDSSYSSFVLLSYTGEANVTVMCKNTIDIISIQETGSGSDIGKGGGVEVEQK